MAYGSHITLTGTLTRNPELHDNPAKKYPMCNMTVAVRHTKPTQKDPSPDTSFINIIAFGKLATNCAQSLKKGDNVIVAGKLKDRHYEHQGQPRTTREVVADNIGHSLRYATTRATKNRTL